MLRLINPDPGSRARSPQPGVGSAARRKDHHFGSAALLEIAWAGAVDKIPVHSPATINQVLAKLTTEGDIQLIHGAGPVCPLPWWCRDDWTKMQALGDRQSRPTVLLVRKAYGTRRHMGIEYSKGRRRGVETVINIGGTPLNRTQPTAPFQAPSWAAECAPQR